jgi:hypothetical protein
MMGSFTGTVSFTASVRAKNFSTSGIYTYGLFRIATGIELFQRFGYGILAFGAGGILFCFGGFGGILEVSLRMSFSMVFDAMSGCFGIIPGCIRGE